MLGKLLKYDFLFSYRIFLSMCGFFLGIALLIAWNENSKFIGFSLLVLSFGFLIAAVVSILLITQSYQKSLYSSNGYLTLTLPVKKGQLILSKLLIAVLWFNVVFGVAGLSGLISSKGALLPTIQWMLSHLGVYASWVNYNVFAIDLILTLYLCMTIGNCSIRNRKLGFMGSFIGFFAIGSLQTWITNFLLVHASIPLVFTQKAMLYNPPAAIWREPDAATYIAIDLSSVLAGIAFCVLIYFINLKLLNEQVNLQ